LSENPTQRESSVRRHLPVIILSALILFHIVSHLVWLALDERQVNWDPGYHLKNSLAAWEVITSPTTDMLQRLSKATHNVEPPLIYVLTAVPYALLGFSADTATYINIVFLCILIVATYGIGKNLYDQSTGLVAACLVSCYPLVAGYVRIYYLDIGLATVVTVSILLLLKTRHFTNRRASLLFGLTLAAGLLMKKAFIIYMFTPMLLVIAQTLFARQSTSEGNGTGKLRLQQLINLAMALALGSLFSAGWYVGRMQSILSQAGKVEDAATRIGYGWSRWTHYPGFLDDVLCTFSVLLLIIGVAVGLLCRDRRLCIPLTWFVGGIILHSLITLGHARYLLPLVPSAALLSAWWLLSLRPGLFKKSFIAAVILLSLGNYSIFSWYGPVGQGPRADDSGIIFNRPFPWMNVLRNHTRFWVGPKAIRYAYPPRKIGWPYEEIMAAVHDDAQKHSNQSLSLVFGADLSGFNCSYAMYFSLLQAVKHSYERNINITYYPSYYWKTEDILNLFDQPYVLIKAGNNVNRANYRKIIKGFTETFNTIRDTVPDRFQVVQEFDLPDGSKASLYRRTGPALSELLVTFDSDAPTKEDVETQLELYEKLARMAGPRNQLVRKKYLELAQMLERNRRLESAIRIYHAGLQSYQQAPELFDGIVVACRELGKAGGIIDEFRDESDTRSIYAICQDPLFIVEKRAERIKETYYFIPHLEQALIVAPGGNHVRFAGLSVAGKSRPVLYQHPDSEVTFKRLAVGSAVTLEFGIGISEKAWHREGDGVRFEIIVSNGETEQTVYSRYIDPKSRAGDRRWFDETLDLQSFADSVISVTFRTTSGPEGNQVYDWAGWFEPRLQP
jgi:hypothetical protein